MVDLIFHLLVSFCTDSRAAVAGPHGVEDLHEPLGVPCRKHAQAAVVGGIHGRPHGVEEARSPARDAAGDLAAVHRAALPLDQALRLQAVQQPGHAGGLLDEALGDLQGGEALAARPPQDPQHVVLLERDAVGLRHRGQEAPHHVAGLEQPQHGLLARRAEGPRLLDLPLQGALPRPPPRRHPRTVRVNR
jgi:hypothetical protein